MSTAMPPSPDDIDAACKAAAESAGDVVAVALAICAEGPTPAWCDGCGNLGYPANPNLCQGKGSSATSKAQAAIDALVSRGWPDPEQTTQRLRALAAAREALRPLADFAERIERDYPRWYRENFKIECLAPMKLFTDARRVLKGEAGKAIPSGATEEARLVPDLRAEMANVAERLRALAKRGLETAAINPKSEQCVVEYSQLIRLANKAEQQERQLVIANENAALWNKRRMEAIDERDEARANFAKLSAALIARENSREEVSPMGRSPQRDCRTAMG